MDDDNGAGVTPAAPEPDALTTLALAAVLSRQSADSRELLGYLAGTLRAAWPEAVDVRHRWWFNLGPAESLTVRLGETHYDLALESGHLAATVGQAVGGVAVRHDHLAVDEWARMLVRDLAATAERSEAARRALQRLAS